ncbi:PREDICTED: uncharacterized protein LOC106628616 [Pseudopodoces humilis]|uniref:uncharacterized protein LOC106628616 n=1 Tax=Pseudopodoces humilis TaxID=181119 RepID=UPI0006B7015F|nr:PREDICTED: uncharacterized protein LOC106628616 [Pseudopodoces humilis]
MVTLRPPLPKADWLGCAITPKVQPLLGSTRSWVDESPRGMTAQVPGRAGGTQGPKAMVPCTPLPPQPELGQPQGHKSARDLRDSCGGNLSHRLSAETQEDAAAALPVATPAPVSVWRQVKQAMILSGDFEGADKIDMPVSEKAYRRRTPARGQHPARLQLHHSYNQSAHSHKQTHSRKKLTRPPQREPESSPDASSSSNTTPVRHYPNACELQTTNPDEKCKLVYFNSQEKQEMRVRGVLQSSSIPRGGRLAWQSSRALCHRYNKQLQPALPADLSSEHPCRM